MSKDQSEIVVVTGVSAGVRRATAIEFGREGARGSAGARQSWNRRLSFMEK